MHVFSVEKDPQKRELILMQSENVHHVFSDVSVMGEEKGFCFKCTLFAVLFVLLKKYYHLECALVVIHI